MSRQGEGPGIEPGGSWRAEIAGLGGSLTLVDSLVDATKIMGIFEDL